MWWHEPYESRGSRTDLREARGETPRAYSAFASILVCPEMSAYGLTSEVAASCGFVCIGATLTNYLTRA